MMGVSNEGLYEVWGTKTEYRTEWGTSTSQPRNEVDEYEDGTNNNLSWSLPRNEASETRLLWEYGTRERSDRTTIILSLGHIPSPQGCKSQPSAKRCKSRGGSVATGHKKENLTGRTTNHARSASNWSKNNKKELKKLKNKPLGWIRASKLMILNKILWKI